MRLKKVAKTAGAFCGVAVAGYAAAAGVTWLRFGREKAEEHSSLDPFFPEYQVFERYEVVAHAPAETAFSAAAALKLEDSSLVRAIFSTREMFLGSRPDDNALRLGLIEKAKQWGWGVLKVMPGQEMLFGAVTQPWVARPVFKSLSPEEFIGFMTPGYVKIAWTLRVDPLDQATSILSTETRAFATDQQARKKFRRYWSMVMPGTVLIRRLALCQAKKQAEAMTRGLATGSVGSTKEEADGV